MRVTLQIDPAQAALLAARITAVEQATARAQEALQLLTAGSGLSQVTFVGVDTHGRLLVETPGEEHGRDDQTDRTADGHSAEEPEPMHTANMSALGMGR